MVEVGAAGDEVQEYEEPASGTKACQCGQQAECVVHRSSREGGGC